MTDPIGSFWTLARAIGFDSALARQSAAFKLEHETALRAERPAREQSWNDEDDEALGHANGGFYRRANVG